MGLVNRCSMFIINSVTIIEIVSMIIILPEGKSKILMNLTSTVITLKLCGCNNKARNSNVAVMHLVHIYFEQDIPVLYIHFTLT